MIATCQPFPRSAAEEMLQIVARAICDRPGESSAQRESRTNQMVHATLGVEPRDGLEYMLSALVFGHFNLILDSMHDVFLGQVDQMKARTKSTIVALDRSMLALVRELREAGTRPLAKWARDAQRAEAAAAEAAKAPPPAEAETPDEPPPEPIEIAPETNQPVESVPAPEVVAARPARVAPPRTQDRTRVMPPRDNAVASDVAHEPTFEEIMAASREAIAAAEETFAEMRALAGEQMGAASGD